MNQKKTVVLLFNRTPKNSGFFSVFLLKLFSEQAILYDVSACPCLPTRSNKRKHPVMLGSGIASILCCCADTFTA